MCPYFHPLPQSPSFLEEEEGRRRGRECKRDVRHTKVQLNLDFLLQFYIKCFADALDYYTVLSKVPCEIEI